LKPAEGTIECWAWDYITSNRLETKLSPPAPPDCWEAAPALARRLQAPGRPPELFVAARADKTRGLRAASGRARVLHTFLHHELQAAELMAWAILAFPDTPASFRGGLLRIALDETRHMRLYAKQIERLGHRVGDFPVRDWFWTRVPTCTHPASFVAIMGLGLESANLEHSRAFATRFRTVGDAESADVQEVVGLEEVAHVRFGVRWFGHFAGMKELEFEAWRRALPEPLSPLLMRGRPLHREARMKAGQPKRFLDELDAWQPNPHLSDPPGS
jgi:uncharacterized ferritin-like protein (DUF455 family)